jgi:hypothetical protein
MKVKLSVLGSVVMSVWGMGMVWGTSPIGVGRDLQWTGRL